MASRLTQSKIDPLTSARFFAALYVVCYHLSSLVIRATDDGWMARVLRSGYNSVSFFFMLSGFILAVVYLSGGRRVDLRRFFLSRFARIYPLYVAALLLDLPHFVYSQRHVIHASWAQILSAVLASVLLVQAWFESLAQVNPPGWSLSAEAFFYLAFPFVGAALWRLQGRVVMVWAGLLYGLGSVGLYVAARHPHAPVRQGSPLIHLVTFLLGVCLARLFVWINGSPRRSAALKSSGVYLLLAAVAVFVAVAIRGFGLTEDAKRLGTLAPLFGAVILALASGGRAISRLFSAAWLVTLGEASFALYLIHFPVLSLSRRWIEAGGMAVAAVYVVVCVALSVASLKLFETPMRKWILDKGRVRSLESTETSAISQ